MNEYVHEAEFMLREGRTVHLATLVGESSAIDLISSASAASAQDDAPG